MKTREFAKIIADQRAIIKGAEALIYKTEEAYFNEHSQFRAGERVIIHDMEYDYNLKKYFPVEGTQRLAFIKKIWISDTGEFNYRFNKAKKDGTESQFEEYGYGLQPIKEHETVS